MSVDERLRAWLPEGPAAEVDHAVRDAVASGRARVARRRVIAGLAGLVVVAGAAGAAVAATREDAQKLDVISPPTTVESAGLFADPTGHVLLFDDGFDGITAIDVDRGVAVRQLAEGQRAGDQSPRLARSGGSFLVGWGDPHAIRLDGSRAAVTLGGATVFVPAVEPDRVWLVDWEGGRIGSGAGRVWQVDTDGNVTIEPFDLPGGIPTLGVPDGIAVEEGDSFTVYGSDASPRDMTYDGHTIASTATQLVFCDMRCSRLRLLDYETRETRDVELPGSIDWYSSQLSPDGKLFVALTGESVFVVDLTSGASTLATELDSPKVAWAPDGTLYAATNSYGKEQTTLWRWGSATGTERIELPIGGLMSFLAVDTAEAGLVDWDAPTGGSCPPPTIQPSGRTDACAIDLTK
jgi:hypothetical protein